MKAGEMCTREVYQARPGDPLADAAREMRRRHVGAIVVVAPDGGTPKPTAIVTDRDIVCGQVRHGADLYCLTVGDVMSSALTTVREDDELADVIKRLASAGVRRAPVVNQAGDLVGMLSFDDILPVVSRELLMLARLIGAQPEREWRRV